MTELFAGTADHYHRFRPPYPREAFDWIATRHGLDGTGRLLDCGCGTGNVFAGLAKWFSRAIAMDPDAGMLAMAQRTAADEHIEAITFVLGRAKDIADTIGPLRIAAFGASFHWTDRIAVARHLDKLVEPGGALVILSPSSLWTGRVFGWKVVVIDTIKHWLGSERRAGPGTFLARPLHQECLKQTPFCALTEVTFVQSHVWTCESIIGYLYSTSFASRAVLGDNASSFEKDLRERLSRLSPDGQFADEIEYSVISAYRQQLRVGLGQTLPKWLVRCNFRFSTESDRPAYIPDWQLRANFRLTHSGTDHPIRSPYRRSRADSAGR